MILNKLRESPGMMVPVGMALITLGLMTILFALFGARFPFLAYFSSDLSDYQRGFITGFALVVEVTGVVVMIGAAAVAASKRK
jgi:hypothetical protein